MSIKNQTSIVTESEFTKRLITLEKLLNTLKLKTDAYSQNKYIQFSKEYITMKKMVIVID